MGVKKDKSPEVRSKIASDLDKFAESLLRGNLVLDAGPLYKAASECRVDQSKPGVWRYSVENLIFRRVGQVKFFQKDFDLENAMIMFSVIIEGKCNANDTEDPLLSLGLSIVITGYYEGENEAKEATSSWHLDKHGFDKETEFMHPIYHLSFGGIEFEDKLDARNEAVLLIDSPRIVHPPMDAILAGDYPQLNF